MNDDDAVRQRNLRTVEAFYQSERDRDLEAWVTFWREDGRQTFPFAPQNEVSGIAELERVTRRKFEVRPPYGIGTSLESFQDSTRVLARLHLTFPDHPDQGVAIWCIFHFDDDGLVTEVEEMVDTASGPRIPH